MRLIPVITTAAFGVLILAQEPSIQPASPRGGSLPAAKAAGKTEPFVQISSVAVEPKIMRLAGETDTVTITVQVFNSGIEQVAAPQIKVAVGTYSSSPPKNNVVYLDTPQRRKLDATPAFFKFKARVSNDTAPGEITVQAAIVAATAGVGVRNADPPGDGRAQFKIE